MKQNSLKNYLSSPALILIFAASNVFAITPLGMTWTPGGYTATTEDIPPTAANGTIVSTITPTSLSATMTANPANNVLGALFLDGNPTGGASVSQNFKLSFDIAVNTQPASATLQPKDLDLSLMGGPAAAGTAGILFGMNIAATVPGPATPWAFRFAVAPTSAGGGVFAMRSGGPINNSTLSAFGNYNVGSSYNLVLEADYTTGLLDAYINGSLALSGFQFATGGAGVSTSEVFLHLNGEAGYANSVTINNLTAAVPEPSALTMLSLGAGLLGMRQIRRSRA
jgi:hypothetical protein